MNRFIAMFVSLPFAASTFASPLAQKIDAAVEGAIEKQRLAGACVLVAHKGEIIHHAAYGHADLKTGRAMTTDTIFRIHSMTKAITSAVALMLLEEGKFQLDDPAAKWIPAFAEREDLAKITVADLLRHTSGFAYGPHYLAAKIWDGNLANFAECIATLPLAHKPGERWTYGLSIDVLGHLIEVWSGQKFADVFQQRVFEPLGMTDTGFYVPEDKRSRLATLYQRDGGKLALGEDVVLASRFEPPKCPSGGGGLVSTTTDYHAFLAMIRAGGKTPAGMQLLQPDSVALMTTSQLPESIPNIAFGPQQRHGVGFGFGFSVVFAKNDEWDASAPVGEFGWGGAASCHYWVSSADDLVVITLEQTMPYDWDLERALKPIIYDAIR